MVQLLAHQTRRPPGRKTAREAFCFLGGLTHRLIHRLGLWIEATVNDREKMGGVMVWALALGIIVIGGSWNSAAGITYDLTKLRSVCVRVDPLSPDVKRDLGLSEESIRSYVFVWMKGKLPRLRVERYAKRYGGCTPNAPTLWIIVAIDISTTGIRNAGYYGSVKIRLVRRTRWDSGRRGRGIAYSYSTIFEGPMSGAGQHVNTILDDLLTDFAAEYQKARNP